MSSKSEQLVTALINGETVNFIPDSRNEKLLKACIDKSGTEGLPPPQSRLEALLFELAEVLHNSTGDADLSDATATAADIALDKTAYTSKGKIVGTLDTQAIFDSGAKSEYDAFWDAFQSLGGRKNYNYAFGGEGGWKNATFYPKYDIIPISCEFMFAYGGCSSLDLVERFEECGITFDTSVSRSFDRFCLYNSPSRFPAISTIGADALIKVFSNSSQVIVEKFILREDGSQTFNMTFNQNTKLETIIFEGTIGQNGLNLQWSEQLTHDSLMSIINCLADYSEDTSGTVWTVTLGETNLAKLTDEEQQIATAKGWLLG